LINKYDNSSHYFKNKNIESSYYNRWVILLDPTHNTLYNSGFGFGQIQPNPAHVQAIGWDLSGCSICLLANSSMGKDDRSPMVGDQFSPLDYKGLQ
jgi:hypothetical protein